MSNKFNEFRFKGFEVTNRSNKYWNINSRINETEDKIIVCFAPEQVFKTAYGFGVRIDHDKGIWLKDWQVSRTWDETVGWTYEIVLDKNYTKIAKFEENDDIFVIANSKDPEDYRATIDDNGIIEGKEWEHLVAVAKMQSDYVSWAK